MLWLRLCIWWRQLIWMLSQWQRLLLLLHDGHQMLVVVGATRRAGLRRDARTLQYGCLILQLPGGRGGRAAETRRHATGRGSWLCTGQQYRSAHLNTPAVAHEHSRGLQLTESDAGLHSRRGMHRGWRQRVRLLLWQHKQLPVTVFSWLR